jgi:glyoxylase-like metal-dependent hydrolase (beta-lactamase superfamily II)
MQLTEHIHMVGGGHLGLSLSNRLDCTVYLVVSGQDAVLIDAGCGLEPELVIDHVERTGITPRLVSRILLTHGHADHAAGAAHLGAQLQAEIWSSAVAAAALGAGDEDAIGLTGGRASGLYPPEVRLAPTPIARRLAADTPVRVGDVEIEVLETPGHAAGHLAYLARTPEGTALFSGDAAFTRGRVVLLGTPDSDLQQLARSVRLLAATAPDMLFPGHCEVALRGGGDHLAQAVAYLDREEMPPGLLS